MKIAFYGSSILSSYWNGAATYYRGIVKELSDLGHHVTFLEPDAFGRQERRDMNPPPWCEVVVYPATMDGVLTASERARDADVVVKASGVGSYDDELLAAVMASAGRDALRIWWDVDAPATLAEISRQPDAPLRRTLPNLDAVFTYGGGAGVCGDYVALGARVCEPVYNAVDPETHYRVPADLRFAVDLAFLGNRLPDRDRRVREFLVRPAELAPDRRFLLGGAGWDDVALPANVQVVGHVPTGEHNAFNSSPLAVLNVNRDSMAKRGFSPPTRIFEAAAAGACLITDAWPGIELFLEPDTEVLVARDGRDVHEHLASLTRERARAIGERAAARMLSEHTYARRAQHVDGLLRGLRDSRRGGRAA